ncbi:PEP-CTERM sorting domain-containing protein [Pontiellaceae bacterium B12227]|nr:PEP-CTERM sorting domain-containing protein [Pontiellaceae bacterium B12227]
MKARDLRAKGNEMNVKYVASGMLFLLGSTLSSVAGIVTETSDIIFWAGSGANSAALVLDFHDGETVESFAWGYRWDGAASGANMLLDIAAADSNLDVVYEGTAASGFLISSISYTAGSVAHSSTTWGYYIDGGFAGDSIPFGPGGDPIQISGGGPSLPASWLISPSGPSLESFGDSGRILEDGAWDAWGHGSWVETSPDDWEHSGTPTSTVYAAVPEPSSVILLMGGFGGLAWFRRRRKYFFNS